MFRKSDAFGIDNQDVERTAFLMELLAAKAFSPFCIALRETDGAKTKILAYLVSNLYSNNRYLHSLALESFAEYGLRTFSLDYFQLDVYLRQRLLQHELQAG